ncbi:hypothetical protein PMKS-003359 [Pichia membranifaciens]|uniref:GPI transamidase component GAA1 n=1 Tax=Pichia membranifaciens TaxID=4926 RepID=A0A1Q2YJY4_9ASCO|nr:hypothetical protein PMKS-003359 [Pichia membranifaciens]
MEGQNRHTYISENALMPSQAHPFFRESEWNFVRGYRNEIISMMHMPLAAKNQVFNDLLTEMGYKTEILNYTDPETGIEKPTLYAIYHVPKGDDTEAMVLTAPWYNPEGKFNVNALALSLGLAKYFRRLSIWAKNIIIIFPDNSDDVLRNWVDAYHTSLDNTGGSIEAAIVLDCPSSKDYLGHIEIEYAGVNGQLPNLDLVNTAIMVAENEAVKVSVNGCPFGQLWTNDYYSRLCSLVNGIFEIAGAGISESLNAQCFSGWNIQAITIRAIDGDRNDITNLGRIIESTFRSVNNLLEKFHQSFFFYLLLDPKIFVSVGMYLPAGGLAAAAFVVASVNAWVGGNDASADVISRIQHSLLIKSIPLVAACLTAIASIGVCVFFALYTSGIFDQSMEFDPFDLTYKWFVLPLFISSLTPVVSYFLLKVKISADYTRALSLIVLFFMGYALVGLMVLNFPLSFVIAICASPLCFVRYASKPSLKRRLINSVFLFISCPALWLIVFGIIHKTEFDLDRLRNIVQYFEFSLLQKEVQNLLDYLEDVDPQVFLDGPVELFIGLLKGYNRVQCWTWIFVCFSWLPVWISMNLIGSIYVYDEISDKEVEKKNQ